MEAELVKNLSDHALAYSYRMRCADHDLHDRSIAFFKERVGESRKLSPAAVEKVAQGRIWSGQAAKKRGLVDELGGLRDALQRTLEQGLLVTDEAGAMEQAGHRPLMIEGHGDNIKITRPEDLALATYFLAQQDARC